jgi:hypothetical protein
MCRCADVIVVRDPGHTLQIQNILGLADTAHAILGIFAGAYILIQSQSVIELKMLTHNLRCRLTECQSGILCILPNQLLSTTHNRQQAKLKKKRHTG